MSKFSCGYWRGKFLEDLSESGDSTGWKGIHEKLRGGEGGREGGREGGKEGRRGRIKGGRKGGREREGD